MDGEISIQLVLVDPPAGVDYGVQHGHGNEYKTMFVQQRSRGDVTFNFTLKVSDSRKDGEPNFLGPYAQGPATGRFVYIDVGTYAGQKNTQWSRRMKIPLAGITWEMIRKAMSKPGLQLRAKIPGTGRDGGPNCATVRLIDGWQVAKAHK